MSPDFLPFSIKLEATFLEAVKIKLYNSVAQNFLALGYQKLGKSLLPGLLEVFDM